MPRLRRVGNGLQAVGDQLLNFALQRMTQQQQLKERSLAAAQEAEHASQLRQGEEEFRSSNDAYLKGLSDPVIGRQRSRAGLAHPDENPTDSRLMTPILEGIGKADSLTKLPTHEEIDQLAQAQGVETPFGFSTLDLPAPVVAGASSARNARAKMLEDEARKVTTSVEETLPDGSKRQSFLPTRDLAGKSFTTGLSAEQQGANAGAEDLAKLKTPGLFEEQYRQASKLSAMQVAQQLAKEKTLVDYRLAAEGRKEDMKQLQTLTQGATEAVLQLEELEALSMKVNQDFKPGLTDSYAGLRNNLAELPYVGPALSGGMQTASGVVDSFLTGDKTIPANLNRLEAMRWQMGIKLIRAAGDPRPSNADVQGVIGQIPGGYESREATQQKIAYLKDSVMMLPRLMYENPGLRGRALLDMAAQKAQERSTSRTPNAPGSTPAQKSAAEEKLNLLRSGGAARIQ